MTANSATRELHEVSRESNYFESSKMRYSEMRQRSLNRRKERKRACFIGRGCMAKKGIEWRFSVARYFDNCNFPFCAAFAVTVSAALFMKSVWSSETLKSIATG